MEIPKNIVTILKKMADPKVNEFEFWNYLDGMDLTEKFFELSSQMMINAINFDKLPKGYRLATYIYYWETNCQFSGWYALENLSSELNEITRSYEDVGLTEEANSICKAAEVWNAETQNYDAVNVAYQSTSNPYSEENLRWEYLNQFFKKNASSLFYN